MKILVACEESQAVCIELRNLGHEAFSCDILDCSGGYPEWHIKEDVLKVIIREHWDMMIAFPPCTYLTVSGNRWFKPEYKDRYPNRVIDRENAIHFFMNLANAPIEKIAIENPVGIMSTKYRKPDQIIQPFYFGEEARKTTCLWLKNLPRLQHDESSHVGEGEKISWKDKKTGRIKFQPKWYADIFLNGNIDRATQMKLRSKTFPGIAKAMAEQWTKYH